jgi:hypothetical protein
MQLWVTDKETGMLFRRILLVALAMLMAGAFPPPAHAAGKAGKSTLEKSSDEDRRDFGVADIEVQSVKTLDTKKLNAAVSKAAGKGEAWTREAVLVALKFAGPGLKGSTKIIDVRTPPESQDTATITISESGYLDDAVGGERWRFWLHKNPNGTWAIQRALWAQLCNRPGHRFYSAERCP